MEERGRRRGTALALAAVLVLFAARFHGFLLGGTLYTRDAGFFFGPWRTLFPTLATEGFPFWNDWLSNGRAYAADPNAAVFWPLSPLLFVATPTALTFANLALVLGLFFLALRASRLAPLAGAAGTAVLLFSGILQSLPVYSVTSASAAPLALAAIAFWSLGEGAPGRGRLAALGAAALALSFLGGEPAITATGAAACLVLAAGRLAASRPRASARESARRLLAVMGAFLLAAGLSAVQLLPASGELRRSARASELSAEHGALFWSVRPSRLLTLLEPRLTGDPNAERAAGFWGAGTFDAGQPYFPDLALGLVPLALAAASATDTRGRAALALAGGAAVLSFGRFLPGYASLARSLSIFRYPEKWWVVATLALAAAAAVGVERLTGSQGSGREKALKSLRWGLSALGGALAAFAALAVASPPALRAVLWKMSLGVGDASAESVATVLAPLFVGGAASMLAAAVVAEIVHRGRAPLAALLAVLLVVFLTDAARRVAGTLPAGAAALFTRKTPAVSLVAGEAAGGRFFDDGADDRATAERRTLEAGGLDPLRPATGVVFGIRYALENDVDRMTPPASVAAAFEAARLPWGERKLSRLRAAGVAVIRTPAQPPDPAGVTELGRWGPDRILAVGPTRPEFHLVSEAVFVGEAKDGTAARDEPAWDPLRSSAIEVPGAPAGRHTTGHGRLEVLARSPRAASLRVLCAEPGCALVVGRTFDPNWRATVDGHAHPLFRADGYLTAAFLPAGRHVMTLRYENGLFTIGLVFSAVSAAVALWLFVRRRAA